MMTRYKVSTLLLVILVYHEVIQQNQAFHCSGRSHKVNVTSSKARTVEADPNFDYCWIVWAQDGNYRVRLNFLTFDINEGYDYVEVGDLWNESIQQDSLLAKFSGSIIPENVSSLSSGMWIKLDLKKGLVDSREIKLKFSLIAEPRNVDIYLSCTPVSSHNLSHPQHDGNYSNNDYRLWWIQTTPPCTIEAKPKMVWLEESHDFVFLGDNIKGPFQRRKWFNLTARRQARYLSKINYRPGGVDLVVVFTSDFHRGKPGFTFDVVANKSLDGRYFTHGPTVDSSTAARDLFTTTTIPTHDVPQPPYNRQVKFYLMILGVPALVVAVLAVLLVVVIRCYMSTSDAHTTHPTYRDSWSKHFPIARSSASTGSSLGRFISFFRHPDGSFSEFFSSGTASSSTFSSGRFSFSSSLYSDYTSSSSSSYRSSIYSRIRTLFGFSYSEDDCPVIRGPSSGNILTTFQPQSPQDTIIESSGEGTSVLSEEEPTNSRISWKTITNSFRFGSRRSRSSSFLSNRWNRTSASSTNQDTDSLALEETSFSSENDSVFVMPRTKPKVQHTYFKGNRVGYNPISETRNCNYRLVPDGVDAASPKDGPKIRHDRDIAGDSQITIRPVPQEETPTYLADDDTDISTDNESIFVIPRARAKVQHTYFKGNKVAYDPFSENTNLDNRRVPCGAHGGIPSDQPEIPAGKDDTLYWPIIHQPIARKVKHTYFKVRNRLGSGSRPGKILGKPLPSIPDRQGGNDKETLIQNSTYEDTFCSDMKHTAQVTRTDGTPKGQGKDDMMASGYHKSSDSSTSISEADSLMSQTCYLSRAEMARFSRAKDTQDKRFSICNNSERLNTEGNVTESSLQHQQELSRNTINPSPDEKVTIPAAAEAASTSGNNPLFGETNKKKIVHIYFKGNKQSLD